MAFLVCAKFWVQSSAKRVQDKERKQGRKGKTMEIGGRSVVSRDCVGGIRIKKHLRDDF